MEDYPEAFVRRARPLLVLSGFTDAREEGAVALPDRLQNGPVIESHGPGLEGDYAAALLDQFLAYDIRKQGPATETSSATSNAVRFHIRPVTKRYVLPIRKTSASYSRSTSPISQKPSTNIHSSLSPLTDGSLMTPLWSTKYLEVVPSVFVSFFPFGDRANSPDEQLVAEINSIKAAIAQSNYRTRHAVVLVGDMSAAIAQDLDDRLAAIRKATRLDAKSTFFYIPAGFSPEELGSMAETILSAIRPAALDFYKDLAKQIRRKRDRGSNAGASPSGEEANLYNIPRSGWTARYEYKLGFMAEMCDEMGTAIRHYNTALDALFDMGGVFYNVSNWSPHWNTARLFADALAVHQLRCFLADGMPTDCARFWLQYHETLQGVLDRKGKGGKVERHQPGIPQQSSTTSYTSSSYGWRAWQSRWSRIMANLIQDSPALPVDPNARKAIEYLFRSKAHIYAPMERTAGAEERYNPWELLHHPGYWFLLAASYTKDRRRLAMEIPESDRTPPGESPSSKVARRNEVYDTFLCPEPHLERPLQGKGIDHTTIIVRDYQHAIDEFVHRAQPSMASRTRLFVARELVQAQRWEEALALTRSLWPGHKWRRSGWWNGVGEVALLLYRAAQATGDRPSQIRALWELTSRRFKAHPDVKYDMVDLIRSVNNPHGANHEGSNVESQQGGAHHSDTNQAQKQTIPRDGAQSESTHGTNPEGIKPQGGNATTERDITLRHEDIVSFLNISFAFVTDESHAGETVQAQIVVTSNAHPTATPITFDQLKIELDGPFQGVELSHVADGDDHNVDDTDQLLNVTVEDIQTQPGNLTLVGKTGLRFMPGVTKVFTMQIDLREAGIIKAARAYAIIETPATRLEYSQSLRSSKTFTEWWLGTKDAPRKRLAYHRPDSIRVQPKLPKVLIRLPEMRKTYYTDEKLTLDVEVINHENSEIGITFEARIPGHEQQVLQIERIEDDSTTTLPTEGHGAVDFILGTLAASHQEKMRVTLQLPPTSGTLPLELKAIYHLVSEPNSPLTKTSSAILKIISPFDTEYTVRPDLNPAPWPSFFDEPVSNDNNQGISNQWTLSSSLVSLATEKLIIAQVELLIDSVSESAACEVAVPDPTKGLTLASRGQHDLHFTLKTRRSALEDLRAVTVDASLKIDWRREVDSTDIPHTTTILAAPSFRLPTSEPRALASLVTISQKLNTPDDTHGTNPAPPRPTPSSGRTTTTASTAAQDIPTLPLMLTLENPSMHFLSFACSLDPNDDFAFSGPKTTTVHLLPLSRHQLKYTLVPFVRNTWVRPVLRVLDVHFGKSLNIHAVGPTAAGLGGDGGIPAGVQRDEQGLRIWVDG